MDQPLAAAFGKVKKALDKVQENLVALEAAAKAAEAAINKASPPKDALADISAYPIETVNSVIYLEYLEISAAAEAASKAVQSVQTTYETYYDADTELDDAVKKLLEAARSYH